MSLRIPVLSLSSHERAAGKCEKHERQPDPVEFGGDDPGSFVSREERFQAQGRDLDGLPGKEVTCVGKRPEDCDAQPAVGQGIQRDVAGDGQECHRTGQEPGGFEPGRNPCAEGSAKQGEGQRMGKTSMPKPTGVRDAETKTDGIKIREKGKNDRHHEQAYWNAAQPQRDAQSENRRGMGQEAGHGANSSGRKRRGRKKRVN